jgi:beta-galactosidase
VVQGLRPTIWRPLTPNEQYIYTRRSIDPKKFPDLDNYTTAVKRWDARPGRIEAETAHRVDDRNSFTVRWTYTPLAGGALEIAWTISPQIEAPWVPETGIEIAGAGLDNLRWLGLGPLDAYPNLKAAAQFGLWRLDKPESTGAKADVRWAEWTSANGAGLRLEGHRVHGLAPGPGKERRLRPLRPYLRLPAPGRLRALSAVEGRPAAKFQRAERSEDRLDAAPGTVLTGSVTLRPLAR